MLSEGKSSHPAVTDIRSEELPVAAGLLARAYRDNPLTIALVGDDAGMRLHLNEKIFGMRIAVQQPPAFVARGDDGLVGVCGFDPPGGSMMGAEERRTLMETMSAAGPGVLGRAMSMLAEWGRRAPKEPHWHLGPVGVEPALQGRGIGGAMLDRFCQMMDAEGELSYLETDTEANACLYEKFGFVTVDIAPVIGVPMWFQIRRPAE
ncbi:MAG: GNAT family N-acetyltransferase [Chloroflexota bacterium]